MVESPQAARAESTWRRPQGRSGPARDPGRDRRIIEAALEILIDEGFGGLTMEKVAVRARVGKPTVYRRWASVHDLVAEAFEASGAAQLPEPVTLGPGRLRDELVRTLSVATACAPPGTPDARVVAAMVETGRRHPEVTRSAQRRYFAALHESIMQVWQTAADRGDAARLPRPAVGEYDGGYPVEIQAVVSLLTFWDLAHGSLARQADVERAVDAILLPLMAPPAQPRTAAEAAPKQR
ncbi:TetR/AcrR family transcriptional regulator [Streptomyces boncukensis]|uniref:TetR/AcrR family transcriptional regulator n=1 Tax=Streptomyces boncukensis TaxID=2711219 RepID=A0A6G4X2Q4_9ACTN|nr:TetR/AcrR family transcriptional regulator [Streptomyces boncukensis]NGO71785.1 TetR/AcrR family transcriptional regulator [Streptomyces boncukensis]